MNIVGIRGGQIVDDQSNSGLARPGRIGFMNVGIRARPEGIA
jgi:hypothetical protein